MKEIITCNEIDGLTQSRILICANFLNVCITAKKTACYRSKRPPITGLSMAYTRPKQTVKYIW
jgi:hypothetical protein